MTKGQPGLVSWFGELLTEKYNLHPDQKLGFQEWKYALHKASFVEPNNTIMNLISKAKEEEHQEFLLQLFGNSTIPFAFHNPSHSYLYMHGVVIPQDSQVEGAEPQTNLQVSMMKLCKDCLVKKKSKEFKFTQKQLEWWIILVNNLLIEIDHMKSII